MTERRVVVFGGSGYVGNSIAELLSKNFDVLVADVKPPRFGEKIGFTPCDVRDLNQVKAASTKAVATLYFAVVQIPAINSEQRLAYQVNVLGLQNACEASLESPSVRGLIQAGTWHVFGEQGLNGVIDESFGFRPDNVEERARVYSLSKIAQESITRLYDNMAAPLGKTFCVVRMGTVIGEDLSPITAAGIFIKNGLNGGPLTPYSHSMYRPMLFVDIIDAFKAYASLVEAICAADDQSRSRIPHIVNVAWPEPITVLDLAEMVSDAISQETNGKLVPRIEVKQTGVQPLFAPEDKEKFRMDASKVLSLRGHRTSY